MNHSVNQAINQESNLLLRIMVLVISLFQSLGCAKADKPGVYRESRGEVAGFTAEATDPAIRVTTFVRLQDGSTIRPYLYYYQFTKSGLFGGVRKVEKIGRTYRSIGRNLKAKYRKLYLPQSREIDSYLFLVSTHYPKEIEVMGVTKKIYLRHDWQLWEVPAKEVPPDKPIVFPAFEELQKRKLSEELEALRQDLVKRYGKIAAAARRKASTPVGQGPMDCESPREPGTYLKGCGEVKPVSTEISDSVMQVARFVTLRDRSVLMPKLKHFWYERKAKENEYALQLLKSDGHKNKDLDLPLSKDIEKYLLLVRRPLLQDSVPESVERVTESHLEEKAFLKNQEWAPWELIEIPSEYISAGKSLKFPLYEELAKRELSEEKQELLNDLVARYNKLKAAAKKKTDTPN